MHSRRIPYLVAAEIYAVVAVLLRHQAYWPINALVVLMLLVLSFVDRRPSSAPFYVLLVALSAAGTVGSLLHQASGRMLLYAFLGLCAVVAIADGLPEKSE